jgi:hypothetical protein
LPGIRKLATLFLVSVLAVGFWACSNKPSESVTVGAPLWILPLASTAPTLQASATPTPSR